MLVEMSGGVGVYNTADSSEHNTARHLTESYLVMQKDRQKHVQDACSTKLS